MNSAKPSPGSLALRMHQGFIEKLKYLTALFQIESDRLKYLRAVLRYGLQRRIGFPETFVRLHGSRFAARRNSMDIPHLANYFEPETTAMLLRLKPRQVVDVGAHVGRYSILLANRGADVVAFEPSDDNFKQLLKNIELNQLQPKITALNLGCSSVSESRELFWVPANEGMASFLERKGAEPRETHKLRRLDEVCGNLGSVDVIKIDVEGFELNVLKGAARVLRHQRPLLIVEIFGSREEKDITHFLTRIGYSLEAILDSRNFVFAKR